MKIILEKKEWQDLAMTALRSKYIGILKPSDTEELEIVQRYDGTVEIEIVPKTEIKE